MIQFGTTWVRHHTLLAKKWHIAVRGQHCMAISPSLCWWLEKPSMSLTNLRGKWRVKYVTMCTKNVKEYFDMNSEQSLKTHEPIWVGFKVIFTLFYKLRSIITSRHLTGDIDGFASPQHICVQLTKKQWRDHCQFAALSKTALAGCCTHSFNCVFLLLYWWMVSHCSRHFTHWFSILIFYDFIPCELLTVSVCCYHVG